MKRFPRGSQWRKWDLHVHHPETKLANEFSKNSSGETDWGRFCELLHNSDVDAIGITDYFSLNGFFIFADEYKRLYPDCEKVFFPCLEMRLSESVNSSGEYVDVHLIFKPDLTRDTADRFLQALKCHLENDGGSNLSLSDLQGAQYEQATVTRNNIDTAVASVFCFGEGVSHTDYLLKIVPIEGNGIRTKGDSGRRDSLADSIHKWSDAFLGNPGNREHYLHEYKYDAIKAPQKPVFSGSDAHSFEDLEQWLGKEANSPHAKYVTWIKADLTFDGLRQTLIEPETRTKIQLSMPDTKEPYKTIYRILFSGTSDFPDEVCFNPGLNSIIGSRSSGKSALLAYIAHAVDPEYTEKQQKQAFGEKAIPGPAASIAWNSDIVRNIKYSVEWDEEAATEGKIIYIPQNSLFSISEHPEEVTAKIQPVLFQKYQSLEQNYYETILAVKNINERIVKLIDIWADKTNEIKKLHASLKDFGDKKAIEQQEKQLGKQIESMQKSSSFSREEIESFGAYTEQKRNLLSRIEKIKLDQKSVLPYVVVNDEGIYVDADVSTSISLTPDTQVLPDELGDSIRQELEEAESNLDTEVAELFTQYASKLQKDLLSLEEELKVLDKQSEQLSIKYQTDSQLKELDKNRAKQIEKLKSINQIIENIKEMKGNARQAMEELSQCVKSREDKYSDLIKEFLLIERKTADMSFSIEIDFSHETIEALTDNFNRKKANEFIDTDTKNLDLTTILGNPESFILAVVSGNVTIKNNLRPREVVKEILTATKDIRYTATLDDDKIGGFSESSMTPGKQALFALILILAEEDEPWPLLIDQPEDDLDSRSICDVLVKELAKRKEERQIIMVSHNANLVVGADSEEVIIANRHGDDRKNRNDMKFDYLTGSLEHSSSHDISVPTVLEAKGIREHACEVLDGGEEAFNKRKEKYRI
jgi:ABC-type cobalamin/Fe3+-siderophores transport system ATPase subunit